MKTVKCAIAILLAATIIVPAVYAQDEEGAAEEIAEPVGLGLTQGQFLLQIIYEVGAERFFDGAITADDAARKVSLIGLSPESGWAITQPLTREALGAAYQRLVAAQTAKDEASEGDETEAPEGGVDINDMTIAELIDRITEGVRKAFARIDTERLPVSPSGWHWK
ncbi:MAG: hypothetical protein O2923_05590 [Verrucomicrobia bacterium]|nr:hypothetical protein [Verrucomicrobiota bacterium]MDA1087295.1 hypothetical protein [Verrucomicrobiota bacterium]